MRSYSAQWLRRKRYFKRLTEYNKGRVGRAIGVKKLLLVPYMHQDITTNGVSPQIICGLIPAKLNFTKDINALYRIGRETMAMMRGFA